MLVVRRRDERMPVGFLKRVRRFAEYGRGRAEQARRQKHDHFVWRHLQKTDTTDEYQVFRVNVYTRVAS